MKWAATSTHAMTIGKNLAVHGAAPLDMPVQVAVALKVRHPDALKQLNAQAHAPLSPQQVLDRFAPTQAQAQAVADYLRSSGFSNVKISANRMLVSATGDAGSAESAFHTSLVSVTTAHGRSAYVNTRAAQVPASLGSTVLSVVGLQTAVRAHTMLGKPVTNGKPAPSPSGTVTGHVPTQFPTIYDAGSTPTASTVSVGIISDGVMTQTLSDLNQFVSTYGLATPNVKVVYAGSQGTDTSGTPEWDLDSQDILAMSGGVNTLYFYTATSLSDSALATAYNKAVSDDLVQVINVSLGECETTAYNSGAMATDDQIFAMGEAQGQTFSISTGDSGSNECSGSPNKGIASYPASSPDVMAISGTTLGTTSSGAYAGETVWSDTGGSPSTVEAKPSWQTQGDSVRDVSDVAFDADPNSGSIIIVNGSNAQYGGTSLAAPLFSATWARMLASHPGLGFAGPHIYSVPASVFHDVTSGSNGAETATVGWDYVTGFGSIDISKLNAAL